MGTRAAYGGAWKRIRQLVLDRDGWRCTYCDADLRDRDVVATVDHVVPVEMRREADERIDPSAIPLDELVAACRSCNSARGARFGNGRRSQARRRQLPRPASGVRESSSSWELGAAPSYPDIVSRGRA